MENKINVAKLLKDCPKGMELDCTMFENLYFDYILKPEDLILCYSEYDNIRTSVTFNKYGAYSGIRQAKCVIFPKGKTSWERFQRPFKDGDIIAEDDGRICIYNNDEKIKNTANYYCGILSSGDFKIKDEKYPTRHFGLIEYYHLATEEERQKLFKAIKDNGYKWNEKTKALEELFDGNKFVIGATITNGKKTCKIRLRGVDSYILEDGTYVFFNEVHNWELASDKFDINTLKIFESRVLVRNGEYENWRPAMFGGIKKESSVPYVTVGGLSFIYLIPYEGNEHLSLSKNDCDDFYKTWE